MDSELMIALPVNALLDALRRPAGEDEIANAQGSCIRWQHHPDLAVPHLVIGDAKTAGGQWITCPRGTSEDVQSLSYAGQLSLPGYSLFDHVTDEKATGKTRHGADSESTQPGNYNLAFYRPKRHEVADYFASYPTAVGIADTLLCGQRASGIGRDGDLFYITSHNL
ncbi:hypothetical protein KEM56_003530 [Ascosphaera pollenicola]|nr:hypothetical protein KEM56_003530 [Ascosphaera pollenicola]